MLISLLDDFCSNFICGICFVVTLLIVQVCLKIGEVSKASLVWLPGWAPCGSYNTKKATIVLHDAVESSISILTGLEGARIWWSSMHSRGMVA